MSKIKIEGKTNTPHNGMYVKSIDKVNKRLEFTTDEREAYQRDSGFYVEAEVDFLKFHFAEEYPEIEYAKPSGW